MSGTTVMTTNPLGRCFVSYRRIRLAEINSLVQALHELGVPTWQDLHNLTEQPFESALRAVLDDPDTASGILWVTPEVADSLIVTNLEIPGLTRRAATDTVFALIPVAAGGLDYDGAADAAHSGTDVYRPSDMEHHPRQERPGLGGRYPPRCLTCPRAAHPSHQLPPRRGSPAHHRCIHASPRHAEPRRGTHDRLHAPVRRTARQGRH